MRANSAGTHLIIDGYVKDPVVFSEVYLSRMFLKLVDALDMTILQGPTFLDVPLDPTKLDSPRFQDEGGTTAFCIIGTSHLSIHTWPLRLCFSLDVFSCRDFDPSPAQRIISQELETTSVRVRSLLREYPPTSPKVLDSAG